MLKYVAPIIFAIILVGIILHAPKYTKWGFEKRLLPPSATDIHEFKLSRSGMCFHLLKAKVTPDEFDQFVRDISAVKYKESDFILAWRMSANFRIPDWWDPTNDVSTTFFDPNVNKVNKRRVAKYENGYLYFHYNWW